MGLRWIRVVKRAIQNFKQELESIYDIFEIMDPSQIPKATNILVTGNCTYTEYITLSKDQKIRVILRRSENSFSLLQWLSMRKEILKP